MALKPQGTQGPCRMRAVQYPLISSHAIVGLGHGDPPCLRLRNEFLPVLRRSKLELGLGGLRVGPIGIVKRLSFNAGVYLTQM